MMWHFGCWREDVASLGDTRNAKQWEAVHGRQSHRDEKTLMAGAAQHILRMRLAIVSVHYLPPIFVIYGPISPYLTFNVSLNVIATTE